MVVPKEALDVEFEFDFEFKANPKASILSEEYLMISFLSKLRIFAKSCFIYLKIH